MSLPTVLSSELFWLAVAAIAAMLTALAISLHYHGKKLRTVVAVLFSPVVRLVAVFISALDFIKRRVSRRLWRVYLRLCRSGIRNEKKVMSDHIRAMLTDAFIQRHYSLIEGDKLDDENDVPYKQIEEFAVGRWDALADVLSYLQPKEFPPKRWDDPDHNPTRQNYIKVGGLNVAIMWKWHINENNNWKYLLRRDKKWGREQRIYFRKDE